MNTDDIRHLRLIKLAENTLVEAGFFTISKLAKINEQELLKYKGIGRVGLEKIKTALKVRGLKLKQTNQYFDFDKPMSVRLQNGVWNGLRTDFCGNRNSDKGPITLEEIKTALVAGDFKFIRGIGKKITKEMYELVGVEPPKEKPKCCPMCERPYV